MTIALIAHDSKKELMVQFCTAYCRILSQHKLVATGTTGKMIAEAVRPEDENVEIDKLDPPLDLKEMLVLAVATSIDALAVGITFAFLNYPIGEAVMIIGLTTFCMSIGGVYVGNFFGNRYKKKAEIAGGIILVLIGVKILLEHLGFVG